MSLLNFFKDKRKHYNVYIEGEVQKVGFRRYAKRLAREMGLSGFVQYYYDALYLEVEGEPAKVENFVNDCRLGPTGANVEEFKLEEGKCRGYGHFKIVRSIKA